MEVLPPEGAFSQASMQSMTKSAQNLSKAASSGGFAISAEGADAYIKAIDNALKELRTLDREVGDLQQETKLGTSPDGQAISRFNVEGALGGSGTIGIIPAIEQLRTALTDARDAMQKAKENYQTVDQNSASSFKRS